MSNVCCHYASRTLSDETQGLYSVPLSAPGLLWWHPTLTNWSLLIFVKFLRLWLSYWMTYHNCDFFWLKMVVCKGEIFDYWKQRFSVKRNHSFIMVRHSTKKPHPQKFNNVKYSNQKKTKSKPVMFALTTASHPRLTGLARCRIKSNGIRCHAAKGFLKPVMKVPHIVQLKFSGSFFRYIFPSIFIRIYVSCKALTNHVRQIIHEWVVTLAKAGLALSAR